jgi:hypothetical protein
MSGANPWRGEVEVVLDNMPHRARLTLGALAELEAGFGVGSMLDLAQRFEGGVFSARDVLAVIAAGLRGGGWQGNLSDLTHVEIAGGPVAAAGVAATLLARAFAAP